MKSCTLPRIVLIFFCDTRFYATVQKFRQPNYVILEHATILGMTLKDLVKPFSGW